MNECGYYSTYVQGCRCEKCKEANSSYHRKYRKAEDRRIKAVGYARRRNHAAMLALQHLRAHDKKAYFEVMDKAREWFDTRETTKVTK